MTLQEIIEWLKSIKEKYIHGGDEDFDKKRKIAIDIAVSVLEKRIPKKPIENKFPWAICPVCGGSVYLKNVQEYIQNEKITYCEHCGQALDWSGTE